MLPHIRTAQLGARIVKLALTASSAPTRSIASGRVAAISEWEKGCMVYRDPIEERDAAYMRATSSNGLIAEGTLLTEEADYLSEARVDYMYKGPCDSTSSLQLNSATQFMLENGGHSQPISTHCATVGGHVPMAANLGGTGLSHHHFKGASSGLGCKFVSNNLLGVHPSRQFHATSAARQQGVQDCDFDDTSDDIQLDCTAQGIQGEADCAQARIWVNRCIGSGLYTDCAIPLEMVGVQRRTVQHLFVQMLLDIRTAAEVHMQKSSAN